MDKTPAQLRDEKLAKKTVEALKARQFGAVYCATKAEALEAAMALIGPDDVVSWGGCMSAAQIGLVDRVKAERKVIDRTTGADRAAQLELMRQALLCDAFLMGANAVSCDGQLVNVDGNGNRLAALCYGPKQVIVIAGVNKLAANLEDAMTRARTVAAPRNAQRFAGKSPCRETGMCADCKSPDCICSQIVTTRFCKPAGRIQVILVGETLGL